MLDFEGLHSLERFSEHHITSLVVSLIRHPGQEELLLVLFNAAISNLILVGLEITQLLASN